MEIARRARRIAVQSALAGMAMSLAAMAVAACGFLPPAFGALLQEGIDVVVILNALRALRGGQVGGRPVPEDTRALLRRFAGEHDRLHEVLPLLRAAADVLAVPPDRTAIEALRRAYTALTERLVPHEEAEEAELLPALARTFGSGEAVAPMSRAHAEIGGSPGACTATSTRSTTAPSSIRSDARTSWRACTGSTPCWSCISFRRRRATSHSSPSSRPTPARPNAADRSRTHVAPGVNRRGERAGTSAVATQPAGPPRRGRPRR